MTWIGLIPPDVYENIGKYFRKLQKEKEYQEKIEKIKEDLK